MRIVNIMLSRGRGGIEQSFIDYTEALLKAGHEVHAITRPEAAANEQLAALTVARRQLESRGPFGIYAAYALRRALTALRPDAVIAHGNRALSLSRRAARRVFPVAGVTHNYKIRRLRGADAIFATTNDLAQRVRELGVREERIFLIPNMVRLPARPCGRAERAPSAPLHIGAMGRFVQKKGFEVFIESLRQLKERGVVFTATLAGGGPREAQLKALAARSGLGGTLAFPGWVEDKAGFFGSIDLFCLPSLHEPFGIVLLEAFAHGVPVIAADSEGPSDIAAPGEHAVFVPRGDAAALARALQDALQWPQLLAPLGAAGRALAEERYGIETVGKLIDGALRDMLRNRQTGAG